MEAIHFFLYIFYLLSMPRGYSRERTSIHNLHYHFI